MIKQLHIYADGGKIYRVVDYHVPHANDDPATKAMHDRHKPEIHQLIAISADERSFDHPATPEELAEAFK